MDYWDSTSFDTTLFNQLRTPDDKFPTDLKKSEVGESASREIRHVSQELQKALAAGDAAVAADWFAYDAVYGDIGLRTQILGRAAIERYLQRALPKLPHGRGSKLRHVLGGDTGGGFEWSASSSRDVKFGLIALELDAAVKIPQLTTVYDSRALGREDREVLLSLSSEPFQKSRGQITRAENRQGGGAKFTMALRG